MRQKDGVATRVNGAFIDGQPKRIPEEFEPQRCRLVRAHGEEGRECRPHGIQEARLSAKRRVDPIRLK